MKKTLTPDDFYFDVQGSDVLHQEHDAPAATSWLINHLQRLSRMAALRSEHRPLPATFLGGRAPSLWDTSVQLDVAAAIYRLLLERGADDVVSLSDCLACACAAALEPLAIRARSELEFYCEPGCTIPAAHAFLVAAIAMEGMTNALRHAHPSGVRGRLSVGCFRRETDLVVEIGDDGVGEPEGFDFRRNAGVGLRSAADMAADIGARLSLESLPLGLRLRLRMPAAAVLAG